MTKDIILLLAEQVRLTGDIDAFAKANRMTAMQVCVLVDLANDIINNETKEIN